uniref:Inhibitor of growth family member 5 n=1 Tax=Bos indicus x Bos taurus TaxID=30522 RepID=A0A4W2DRK1_BOBOX
MATAMYLEHYLDSIENLPCELQRNFQLMRELDQRTEDKKAEIDILAAEYISTVKTLSSDQRVEHLQKIQSAYNKCKEYSDDKVQLAMQTYEMVDKHIRRLDADLARFEADLKDKLEGSDFESAGGRGLKKGRGQKEKRGSRGRGRRTSEDDTPKKKKHKGGSEFTDTILSVHPSDVLDMPVDPNEPTYCLCHQVSYGEMIGCDNPDCPIEWFHFACVDLTTKPKGKWSVWRQPCLWAGRGGLPAAPVLVPRAELQRHSCLPYPGLWLSSPLCDSDLESHGFVPLPRGCFSVVNTTVPRAPWWAEPADAEPGCEEPWVGTAAGALTPALCKVGLPPTAAALALEGGRGDCRSRQGRKDSPWGSSDGS